MKLFDICQNIHPLIFAREDRPLTLPERAITLAHTAICKSCRQVQTNVVTLRLSLKAWRNYKDE